MQNQKLRITLRQDVGRVIVRSRTSGGEWGEKQIWTIQRKSNLPRAIFHAIRDHVRQAITSNEDAVDFVILRKMVRRALYHAAELCGCKAEFRKEGAHVVWYLDQVPLIGFHVAKSESKSPAVEQLLAGSTIFRWTIMLAGSSYFRVQPWDTNPKWRITRRDAV